MKLLFALLEKLGMNKGDATSGGVVGGASLALIYMLFVTGHQYERDAARQEQINVHLEIQVQILREALIADGVDLPEERDDTKPTKKENKNANEK